MRLAHDIAASHENAAQTAGPVSLPARIGARLRAITWSLILLAGVAVVSQELLGMPYWLEKIRQYGFLNWFYDGVLPDVVTAFILLLAVRASADNGTDLARRPGRFLLVLALGAIVALAVMSAIYALLDVPRFAPSNRPLDSYLIGWLNSMLFGALFGWLGILHLQRMDDQARFSAAMSRRSLLARQVTQSRLIAARSQVDPELVAGILRRVRARYNANGDDASALLDQLIGHLRLAMTRVRERMPSPAAEVALIRSYLALRAAESGLPIAFHTALPAQEPTPPEAVPIPIFPIVRRLCDEAVLAGAKYPASRIDVRVERIPGGLSIELELSPAAIPPERFAQMKASFADFALGNDDTLQHFAEPESNRYVVQAAVR